jgi:hypothetical protein
MPILHFLFHQKQFFDQIKSFDVSINHHQSPITYHQPPKRATKIHRRLQINATMRIASILTLTASLATFHTSGAFTTPSSSVRIQRRHDPVIEIPSPSCRTAPTFSRPITRLFMGWGPEPIWSTGFVSQTIQACPSGSCVSLKVQVEDGSGFVLPGQYVQVRPSGCEYQVIDVYISIY